MRRRFIARTVLGIAVTSMLGMGASACATSEESFQQAEDSTPPTEPYMPLPEGVELERAGTGPITPVKDTALLGSLRPGNYSAAERVPEIIKRGRLIVGVDQSQNLLSFRDPISGEIKGFEVDLIHEIARDIFGDPNKVEFKFVTGASWAQELDKNHVDLVVRGISITHDREDKVFFSIPYLRGNTRILTHKEGSIQSVGDLAHKTACVTSESTNLQRTRIQAPETDIAIAHLAADCMVMFQQGQVDAIISDDTILSGMAAQDPLSSIVGEPLGTENYGIAMARPTVHRESVGLIRQVNYTLERIARTGQWSTFYNRWLGDYLPAQQPPAPIYRPEDSTASATTTPQSSL